MQDPRVKLNPIATALFLWAGLAFLAGLPFYVLVMPLYAIAATLMVRAYSALRLLEEVVVDCSGDD